MMSIVVQMRPLQTPVSSPHERARRPLWWEQPPLALTPPELLQMDLPLLIVASLQMVYLGESIPFVPVQCMLVAAMEVEEPREH